MADEAPEVQNTTATTPPPAPTSDSPPRIEDQISKFQAGEFEIVDTPEGEDAVQEQEAGAVPGGQEAEGVQEVREGLGRQGEDQAATSEAEEVAEPGDDTAEPEDGSDALESKAGDTSDPPFVARLPGRRPDDPDVELEIEGLGQPEQEAFNRLRKGYVRGVEAEATLDEARDLMAQVEEFRTELQLNPRGFLVSQVQPEMRAQIAKDLLSDPNVWQAVLPDLARWDENEAVRQAESARLELERVRAEQDAVTRKTEMAELRRNANEVHDRIKSMIPEGTSDTVAEQFLRYSATDLEAYVKKAGIRYLDPDLVPAILEKTQATDILGRRNGITQSSAAVRANTPTDKSPALPAEQAGERLVKASARKREASTVAPAGAAATPVNTLKPPSDLSGPNRPNRIEDLIAWVSKQK